MAKALLDLVEQFVARLEVLPLVVFTEGQPHTGDPVTQQGSGEVGHEGSTS
jgi:hypothetical protein